jgi:MFS family permease
MYGIYEKLQSHNLTKEQLWAGFYTNKKWLFVIAILLMPVNWCIETYKWQRLVNQLHPTNFLGAMRGVLSGMSVSLFLPNRVGEFGGRVLQLPPGMRLQGIAFSIIGSQSQLFSTVLYGTLALWVANYNGWLETFYQSGTNYILKQILNYIALFATIITGMIYWRIPWILTLLERIPFIKKFVFALKKAEQLTTKDLTRTFLLSSIRYATFLAQYVFMLQVFNVQIPLYILIVLVAVYYLIMAVIPSITIAELGIRGKVAISLFGVLAAEQMGGITLATSIIFILNLLVPAAIGSITLLRVKWQK